MCATHDNFAFSLTLCACLNVGIYVYYENEMMVDLRIALADCSLNAVLLDKWFVVAVATAVLLCSICLYVENSISCQSISAMPKLNLKPLLLLFVGPFLSFAVFNVQYSQALERSHSEVQLLFIYKHIIGFESMLKTPRRVECA